MKSKALLLLSLMTLSLAACGTNTEPNSSGSNNSNEGQGNQYSQALKDCATQMLQISQSPSLSAKRGFSPMPNPGPAVAFAPVYLYWSALLEEIDGVTVVGQAIHSPGKYQMYGEESDEQVIDFDISVDFDVANNKFTFLGRQNIPNSTQHSYCILTCNYNFTSKELASFSVIMQPDNFAYGNYVRYSNNEFESYTYGMPSDNHELDPDFIEYNAYALAGIATLDALIENEVALDGEKLNASRQAFIAACELCDTVTNTDIYDVIIVND